MLFMNILSISLLSRCSKSLYSYHVPKFIFMGCPSLISWSFFFTILLSKCSTRGIMKAAWFNMPYRDSIFFPLNPLFSCLFGMSLDQYLYLSSSSLTVSILVSWSHLSITLISYSCPYDSILLNYIDYGL